MINKRKRARKTEPASPPVLDRRIVLLLAVQADCVPQTARRALTEGVASIKGAGLRERLTAAALALGVPLPFGRGVASQ